MENRDTEFFIAAADDAFYAITLPGLKVRYCFVDAAKTIGGFAPHYLELGIAMTPAQLAGPPASLDEYSRRLASEGVRPAETLGSAILLGSAGEMRELMRVRPDADFDMPAEWLSVAPVPATHEARRTGSRVFVVAKNARKLDRHRELPAGW